MSAGRPQFLQPRFHQVMLATWVCAAIAHGAVVVVVSETPIHMSIFGLVVVGCVGTVTMMAVIWRMVDPALDALARRGALRAIWQRLVGACVVTPLVAVPTGFFWGIGYPLEPVIMGSLVFVPWGALLVWMLSPRRSAQIRRYNETA